MFRCAHLWKCVTARTFEVSKLEKVEEKKFVLKVEACGWFTYKLQMIGPFGKKGYNDRIVWADHGVSALFEFKQEGEVAEKLQDYRHRQLKALGHHIYVVVFAEEAFNILIRLVEEAKAEAVAKAQALSRKKR